MSINLNAQGDLTIGGDVVGRDKIINNIQSIVQRALTAAEEADQDKALEAKYLAQGVSAFAQRLQARASEAADTGKGGPYKGLMEYRLSDAEIFFGRSQAIAALLGNLQHGPLTILHAESGAGKTSLLQAGIMPRLIGAGHLPVYLRPYDVEPSLAIKRAFLPDLGATPLLATAPLRDFLRQTDGLLGERSNLYIFLDQFEEFFTQQDEAARDEFIRELAECLDDETLSVRWVLAMRTEYFGNLANFRPRIRNPFENDSRLNRLNRAEAHEVVVEPAKRRGITVEPGLVEAILDDLGSDAVQPPQIQLVCSILYEERPAGSNTITRQLYDAQGGAAGILRGHLERVLKRDLPPDQGPIAQRVLEALISADSHRLIRSRNKLLVELNASGPPLTMTTLEAVLTQLVDSRLLRVHDVSSSATEGYETTSGLSYELTHDYLLEQIKVDPAVQARKAAQELLEQEVKNFERYGTLLSDDKLAVLAPRRKELVTGESAQELLDKSDAALRRRRGILRVGAGVVILLFVIGVVSGLVAFFAQQESVRAATSERAAETQAAEAAARQGDAENAANNARFRQATAEAAEATAAVQAEQAVGSAATATIREAQANAVVQNLFKNNGLVPVGDSPIAFAFDGQFLWVASAGGNAVQAIDPASGVLKVTVAVGHQPGALAFDTVRKWLWVASQDENVVQAIDVTTLAVVARADTGQRPSALAFDGTHLWVANYNDSTIEAIDPATGQASAPVHVGAQPWVLVFDDSRLWVANRNGNTVQAIDPLLNSAILTVTVGSVPGGLAWDGNLLWVSSQINGNVQAINPVQGTAVFTIPVGLRPGALAFDGLRLWVANEGDGTVQAIDRVLGTVSAPIPVGQLPRAFAFAGNMVWVANFSDNTVQAIDPAGSNVAASIPVGKAPRGMAFDGQLVWVVVSGESKLQAIDPKTGELGAAFPIGRAPRDVVFDGKLLWVANQGDNNVQAFDPANGQLVTTVPITNPRVILFDGQRLWVIDQKDRKIQRIDPITRTAGPTIDVGKDPFDLTFDGKRLWVVNNGDNTVQAIDPDVNKAGVPIPVGSGAGTLEFDGQRVWVTDFNEGAVQAIDPDQGKVIMTVHVGAFPAGQAFDGEKLWVVNFGDNTVQAIDPQTGAAAKPVRVGASPIGTLFDGHRLWISSRDANTVQYIIVRR